MQEGEPTKNIKAYSVTEARANLARVVREAEQGTQVNLTRHGRPVAVLIGAEGFERLSTGEPGFWQAYEEFRQRADLTEAGIDPEEVFGDVRDSFPGRDFDW